MSELVAMVKLKSVTCTGRHGCPKCCHLNWLPWVYWRLLPALVAIDKLRLLPELSPWMYRMLLTQLAAMHVLKAVTWTDRHGWTEGYLPELVAMDELKAIIWTGRHGFTEGCYLNWSPWMYWRLSPELVASDKLKAVTMIKLKSVTWGYRHGCTEDCYLNCLPWMYWGLLPELVAKDILKAFTRTCRHRCTEYVSRTGCYQRNEWFDLN